MAVFFFYVDESYDAQKFCLSALCIRHRVWKDCYRQVREFRVKLKDSKGLFLRKEIHAADLVAGRGNVGARPLGKWERARIFHGLLELVSQLPEVKLFNICLPRAGLEDPQLKAWERLINRIERTMKEYESQEAKVRTDLIQAQRTAGVPAEAIEEVEKRLLAYRARAIIIADEGREPDITRTTRRMSVFNPIPSRFGQWEPGVASRNIATEHILEDPFFKQSHQSYFLQLADCVAFALLKREVPPTPSIRRYGIHKMFDASVARVCFRRASPRDPLGIVRK